jgi:putative radical SAM enzyme (TIGR03279 family)
VEVLNSAGGVIAGVEAGSAAERAGIQPGWRLLTVNGHPVRDVVDYRFYTAEPRLRLELDDGATIQTLRVRLDEDEALGLEFAAPTFDDITRCRNKCPFCFLKGLPKGLRRSLYVKDDDYRYSFLFGNFITLSKLSEADWARLAEQRLSPLYVSVHATDRAKRNLLLGIEDAPDILEQLDRLAALKIEVHTQLVICPGLNDGVTLDQSIADLAARYPTVQSVAVVPVGLTHRNLSDALTGLRLLSDAEIDEVLDHVHAHQRCFRRELGVSLVHASDEYYLRTGRSVPGAAAYDGYPQYQNGVGMVRSLVEDWKRLRRKLTGKADGLGRARPRASQPVGPTYTLVCGTLIAPVLAPIVASWTSCWAGERGWSSCRWSTASSGRR